MQKRYDTIIIGAGIAGASLAHALQAQNQEVLVIDKKGIASGGSGAAGAFISPKIGKASALHALTNEAFAFAHSFYSVHFSAYFHRTGVVRIPQNPEDAKAFGLYEEAHSNPYAHYDNAKLKSLGIKTDFDAFYFPEAGDCDAVEICHALLKESEVVIMSVDKVEYEAGVWSIAAYQSRNLVLATGHESDLIDVRYMGINGTWGTRADFDTALNLELSIHQSMSISANNKGLIKLGATHEREIKTPKPCIDTQALMLQKMANSLVDTRDFRLHKSYCGMRAGSRDYMPLLGKVLDVKNILTNYPHIKKGGTVPLTHKQNLYIYNGLGGRGFVFAPYLAKMLADAMVQGKEIDPRVNPDRLFFKWCRKLA